MFDDFQRKMQTARIVEYAEDLADRFVGQHFNDIYSIDDYDRIWSSIFHGQATASLANLGWRVK